MILLEYRVCREPKMGATPLRLPILDSIEVLLNSHNICSVYNTGSFNFQGMNSTQQVATVLYDAYFFYPKNWSPTMNHPDLPPELEM